MSTNGSNPTRHEVFVEISPLEQQRTLSTPQQCFGGAGLGMGASTEGAGETVPPEIRRTPTRFFVRVTKNRESTDHTKGFCLGNQEVCEK